MPVLKVKKNGVWEEVTGGYTPTGVAYLNTDASTSVAEVFSDSEKTSKVFPETKTSAVLDESGNNLDELFASIDTKIDNVDDKVDAIDLASLGGAPIIDARSASFDMDAEIAQGRHFKIYFTDENTLGTPYAYGKSSLKSSCVISYGNSTTYGFQLAIVNGGNRMFQRRLSNGTLYDWTTILPSVMSSSEYGTSLPTAGTKGRIFFKKA